MKHLFFCVLVLTTLTASAQDCTKELLAQKPGAWKANPQGSIHDVSAADLAKEKSVLAAIHKMVSANYSPKGCQVNYSTVYGKYTTPGETWLADPYHYAMYILRYLCDPNSADKSKYYVDVSTPTTVNITSNVIFSLNNLYAANISADDFRGYLKLKEKPVKKDGYYFMGEEVVGDGNLGNKVKEYRWLITYNDTLPFYYVSRKEYLLITKKRLEKTLKESPGEAEYTNKYISNVNEYLKKSETELNQPAICMWNDEERFERFVEEGTKGSFIAVKPNFDYYHKKLPKSFPQFFTVVYKLSKGDAVFEGNIEAIKKAVDFAKLKNMLGKEPGTNTTTTAPAAAQPVVVKKNNPTAKNTFDIYKNEPTPGFKPAPVSSIIPAAKLPATVDSRIKAKVLAIQLTASSLPAYLTRLLADVEKNINQQEQRNTQNIYAKLKNNPADLADMGVMLFYKGAVSEAIWCLAKAAVLKPTSDYILSNFTGILNLADAEARALPVLRYLKTKHPTNTTVLNNLGQALFGLGELNSSKAVLDSCIRIFAYHPQANVTRAVIAEKEGKSAEATKFIENSLKQTFSDASVAYAKRKKINLDFSNILNRYRPSQAEYINPRRFIPPAQCVSVFEKATLEPEWDEWREMVKGIQEKINGGLTEATHTYAAATQKQLNNPTKSNLSMGPLMAKAQLLHQVYLQKVAGITDDANTYFSKTYSPAKALLESENGERLKTINKKYASMSGEGKGSYEEARCNEINASNNLFLKSMADLNNDFNQRFAEPIRSLHIEMMYWSRFLPGPDGFREMQYYHSAVFAVSPFQAEAFFINPCTAAETQEAKKREEELEEPSCPISFRFKIKFAKLTGDCSKFELEIEAEGLVFNYEKDFVHKKSTLAFGIGASVDSENIPEIIDGLGGGIGAKAQGYIEFDGEGISDIGLRGEAGIDSPGTDKGDLKVNGKIGVNSGIDAGVSPAVQKIGAAISSAVLN